MFNENDAIIWEKELKNPDYFSIQNEFGFIISQIIETETEIFMIYIKPEFRGFGHGKKLLQSLIEKLKMNDTIFLEVSSENLIAHGFYNLMGFEEYNRRKKYYKDNSDAILMRYTISN